MFRFSNRKNLFLYNLKLDKQHEVLSKAMLEALLLNRALVLNHQSTTSLLHEVTNGSLFSSFCIFIFIFDHIRLVPVYLTDPEIIRIQCQYLC